MKKKLGKKVNRFAQSIAAYNDAACENSCVTTTMGYVELCSAITSILVQWKDSLLFNKYYSTVKVVSGN